MREKLICQNCNHDYFPNCYECNSPIRIGEKQVTLPGKRGGGGLNWHQGCLNCFNCLQPIKSPHFTLKLVPTNNNKQVPCCDR
jgi:hypothetical protein